MYLIALDCQHGLLLSQLFDRVYLFPINLCWHSGQKESIIFLVGFRVTSIGFATCVEKLAEKVMVIWIAVALAADGFDYVVDSLNLSGGDVAGRVNNDALEVRSQKTVEP